MSNPVLRQGFRTATPVAVRVDAQGRTHQVPLDPSLLGGPVEGRMTLDDVLLKTMGTIGLMVVLAGATFVLAPDVFTASAVTGIGGLVAFVTSLVVTVRKRVGAAGALFFAAVEGIFIGGLSRVFETRYDGIVSQAVLGTFVAAGVTLAAHRFWHLRLGAKLRRGLMIAMVAYVVTALLSFLLSLVGLNLGLYDAAGQVSLLGLGFAALGVGLAVASLLSDLDDVARGIAAGAPASESWRAAFGLTVTMVWLYTNILRILSFFRR